MTKAWQRTNDAYGHKPKFKINCVHCKTEMRLRHSTIVVEKNSNDEDVAMNQVCFKCPVCDWFTRFYVDEKLEEGYEESTVEYLKRILKDYRDGKPKLIPIFDFKEDELIKQRLKDLGYW